MKISRADLDTAFARLIQESQTDPKGTASDLQHRELFFVTSSGHFVPYHLTLEKVGNSNNVQSIDVRQAGFQDVREGHSLFEKIWSDYVKTCAKHRVKPSGQKKNPRRRVFWVEVGNANRSGKERHTVDPVGLTPDLPPDTEAVRIDAAQATFQIDSLALLITPTDGIAFWEGGATQVTSNRYERSNKARLSRITNALAENDGRLPCAVCNVDFSEAYGVLGAGFIHIHHEHEIAHREGSTATKLSDLWPVCPNCHAMLHRRKPALSITELREILSRN